MDLELGLDEEEGGVWKRGQPLNAVTVWGRARWGNGEPRICGSSPPKTGNFKETSPFPFPPSKLFHSGSTITQLAEAGDDVEKNNLDNQHQHSQGGDDQ